MNKLTKNGCPVADGAVDFVVSRRMVNWGGEKRAAVEESFHVQNPEGILAISDVVKMQAFPESFAGPTYRASTCSLRFRCGL